VGRRHATTLLKLRPDDKFLREQMDSLHDAEASAQDSAASSRSAADRTADAGEETAQESGAQAASASRGATLRSDAGSVLELPPALRLEPEDEDFIAEHMTEAEVFVKYGLGDRAVEQLSAVLERFPGYVPAIMKLKELHLEEGNRDATRAQMVGLVKAHLAADDALAAGEAFAELKRFDPNCPEVAMLGSTLFSTAAPAGGQMARAGVGSSVEMEEPVALDSEPDDEEETIVVESEPDEREPTAGELQEVDRFLERGKREEAVAVLRRLVLDCGSHPEIVSRMKTAMAMSAATLSVKDPQLTHKAPEPEELDLILDPVQEEQQAPAGPQRAPVSASPAVPSPQAKHPGVATASSKAAQGPPANDVSQDISDLADLASEIDAALMDDTAQNDSLLAGIESTPEGHSLEEIVQAFKKGIEQQVSAEDFDTHYNLGIAYKEMGLMDEAIGEFQFAAKEPRMLVDCCSMLGICFREKGMSALAVKWYRRGLEAAGSRDEETVLGLRYDLAELLAEMGEHRQAIELFTEVFGINSKYRDVSARIRDLERQLAR
jgi:tetratricopeptide (TPR) repeat protein